MKLMQNKGGKMEGYTISTQSSVSPSVRPSTIDYSEMNRYAVWVIKHAPNRVLRFIIKHQRWFKRGEELEKEL